MTGDQPFIDTCLASFWSAPLVARMRAEGPHGRWADQLRELLDDERVAPLRQVLTDLADDGLQSLDPFDRFLREDVPGTAARMFAEASAFGAELVRRRPGAAYLITLTSVVGWAQSLGERLHGQEDGYPDRGWTDMPYAYARAALKIGDVRGAAEVIDVAYDTLMAARHHDHPALVDGISRYRELAGEAERRLEQVVDNLADDLLGSGLRVHLLALLWTLGFIPECQALRRSGALPSRTLVRALIRLSLERIPNDPLTQYVWLELKDRPPLDLRGHQFFYLINRRYGQYYPDIMWEAMPSQEYARALIAWLGETLTPDQMGAYLELMTPVRAFEKDRQYMGGTADWSVYLRMISLAYLLAAEYDMLAADPDPEQQLVVWRSLLAQVTRMRARHHLNPHRSDLAGTLDYPVFHLIENLSDPAERVQLMEQYRAAAMTFQLAATAPTGLLPRSEVPQPQSDSDGEAGPGLEQQLGRESELLGWLRGAQFVVNFPFLPQHFHRYATDEIWPHRDAGLDLETGRRDYLEVERLLSELYAEMDSTAGEYTARRRDPSARIDTIVAALRQHTLRPS